MTLPTFTLRQLVEAGVHFGHHARRWNPQMAPYIYGKKDNVHIIDLQKTYPMLYTALAVARDVAAKGGKVLFVATKRQAQDIVKESAERCGQYYVNYRWLGGMLTNWKTVNKSINRLVKLNEMEEKNAYDGYTIYGSERRRRHRFCCCSRCVPGSVRRLITLRKGSNSYYG